MKKHLALCLALIMIFQMFPVSVFADDGAEAYQEAPVTAEEVQAPEAAPEAAAPAEAPADRGWASLDSEVIARAEYHTVTFKDRGITRSKRAVAEGMGAGSAPGEKSGRPIYGWTQRDNDRRTWFDEAAPVTENFTVTSVPANAEEKTESVSAGDVSVTATAPAGALPQDAALQASAVSEAEVVSAVADVVGEDHGEIHAVDLSYYSATVDEAVEPLEAVSVTMAVAGMNPETLTVIHILDDGSVVSVPFTPNSDGTITFEADSFSVYVVVETVIPRLTVTFKNGETEIATMYVKAADTTSEVVDIINDPGAGTIPNGQVFKGWTTDQEYTNGSTFFTIDQVRADAMTRAAALNVADGSVTYYAGIFKQYTVTYVDGAGITVGSEVATTPSRSTEASYTVNMGYTTDDKHNFEGWSPVDGQSNIVGYPNNAVEETITTGDTTRTIYYYPNGTELTLTGDVKFSVDAPEGHWLVFDENGKGATYNAPRFIKAGDVTSDEGLITMTRKGYSFENWYTGAPSETGGDPTGSVFQFGNQLNETTTIYAKWNANPTANYTVILWKEKITGDGYDFVETISGTGTVGQNVSAVTQQGTGNNAYARINGTNYQYTGFHLKEFTQNVEINPEGTAVVDVYYDRHEITYRLYESKSYETLLSF